MASGYALPNGGAADQFHAPHTFPNDNGSPYKQVSSQGLFSPKLEDHDHFDPDGLSHNGHIHSHSHSHSTSHSPLKLPMKGRLRGESDLGRPAHAYVQQLTTTSTSTSQTDVSFSLPELLTGLLIPLPYLLASAAYSSSAESTASFPPLSAYAKLQQAVTESGEDADFVAAPIGSSVIQACTLTSGTLLLVGFLAKIRSAERVLDRRKSSNASIHEHGSGLLSATAVAKMVQSFLSIGLPYYAAMQLGGMRTGLLVLVAVASGLMGSSTVRSLSQAFKTRQATLSAIILCIVADLSGMTLNADSTKLILGYLAMAVSTSFLELPLPSRAPTFSGLQSGSQAEHSPSWEQGVTRMINSSVTSPLVSNPADVSITIVAGFLLCLITVGASIFFDVSPPVSMSAMIFSALSMAAAATLILFGQPYALRTNQKAGLLLGCLVTASSSFLFSPGIWPGSVVNGALCMLSYLGVMYDTSSAAAHTGHGHNHDHAHTAHKHHHNHDAHDGVSTITSFLLARVEPGSLYHGILVEKDSRRIAYFTCLNFGFMLVQAFYGWVSGSLGLLSDTVHMFFDCLALIVGLGAAVASKWPTSPEKPYGWGKLNTLAGFGNGIFLMLVSVEFVWEAIEGIIEGKELRRVQELLVVSTLGFLVNMVGLLAFGHAHAGHDHGHGHDHSHSHSHSHTHSHDHGCDHSHSHTAAAPAHAHHGHENENMHGIYLHIAADAGGSLAVILSTLLTLWYPWYLWDPLATIAIAALIFAAAVPLVRDSGKKLLLVIPDELEYGLKNTLQELSTLRGVVSYAVPRFWVGDEIEADPHDHAHDHSHDHAHDHEPKGPRVQGVIHVVAARVANLEDVRVQVLEFFAERNMEVVVQVEREGEGRCWCGGSNKVA